MDQGWKRRRYSESASRHLQLWRAFSRQLRTTRHSPTTFPSWIQLKMYFHSWICTYAIYCGVAMATGYSINRVQLSIKDTHWEFNGGHCSGGLVSQRSSGGGVGGLCGCTWKSEREMWYTRSKLQQQLSVGKTFSPCLFCGMTASQRNCSSFFSG